MATPLTEYFENLRTILNDAGTVGTYAYRDEQLAAALRTVIQTGKGPSLVLLTSDGTQFDPAPATPDARGLLTFNAALILIGGSLPVSFKTRPMSVHVNPLERQETIRFLRRAIQDLENNGDPHGQGGSALFGVWQDYENCVFRRTIPVRTA